MYELGENHETKHFKTFLNWPLRKYVLSDSNFYTPELLKY